MFSMLCVCYTQFLKCECDPWRALNLSAASHGVSSNKEANHTQQVFKSHIKKVLTISQSRESQKKYALEKTHMYNKKIRSLLQKVHIIFRSHFFGINAFASFLFLIHTVYASLKTAQVIVHKHKKQTKNTPQKIIHPKEV